MEIRLVIRLYEFEKDYDMIYSTGLDSSWSFFEEESLLDISSLLTWVQILLPYKELERKRKANQRYYLAHKEKIRAQQYRWREEHPELVRKYCREWYQRNKEKIRIKTKLKRQQLRERIIELLGGRCIRCGYHSDSRALQIDHVRSNGHSDRKHKSSITYLKSILKEIEEGSERFQLLCANCNFIKAYERREFEKNTSY